MSFSMYDFRDLDLMLAVEETNGGVTTNDLAKALGSEEDAQAVAIRMTWMRRYGVFEFDPKKRLWSLSRGGERVLEARRQAVNGHAIEIPDAAMIDAMAHIASRYRQGDAMQATLLRREFLYGTKMGQR